MTTLETLAAAVLAFGLAGCQQERPAKVHPQPESAIASTDQKAMAYVKAHNCHAFYRQEGHLTFDYDKGEPKYTGANTAYACTNPDVNILIDDAPTGGPE